MSDLGGITELTAADYNWPETGTKTKVALWKLKKPGLYKWTSSFAYNVLLNSGTYAYQFPTHLVLIYTNPRFDSYTNMVIFGDASVGNAVKWMSATNATGNKWHEVTFQPTDSLTSTSNYVPLAASQGKILNDKITPASGSGAPTTATVGIVGKIYVDTDTDTAYMCTKVSGSEYTWKQITA